MTSPSGSSAGGQAVAGDDVSATSASGVAGPSRAVTAQHPVGVEVRPGAGRPTSLGYDVGPAWTRFLPPVVALMLALWGITGPSFWRDEAATIAAVRRPFGDLIRMLGNVDAVHSLYYMMMWPIEHVFGPGELVLRLPSALAASVAAAAVAAIGRRLISPWAGLVSGLIFAMLPVVSRYGQEARSYEMVIALAALASYLLIRVLGSEPGRRRRWLIGYGACIGALGIMNIFGLLLLPAHAVTVALHCRRDVRDPATRRLAVGWLAAAVVGLILASPLLVLGWNQRGQIAWLSVNTSSSGFQTVFSLSGSYLVTTVVIALIVVALVLGWDRGGDQRRADWPGQLVSLSLPWMIVPPAVLFAASLIQPVYTSRYILLCIPALALVAGAAIASFSQIAGYFAVVVILVAGLMTQLVIRGPAGHYDDIKAVDQIVAAHARPGDVVLYTNPNAESFGTAYPFGLGALPDVTAQRPAIASGTLAGATATLAQIRARLLHAKRLWVVEINSFNADPQLLGLNGLPVGSVLDGLSLTFTNMWQEHGDYLILYTRG